MNVDTPGFHDDGTPMEGNLGPHECTATELGSGRVVAYMRPIYSPVMWESWSEDGGRTWGPAVRGPFAGYASPNMVRTASGALLIAHRMPGLTLHCSHDDGLTWDQGTMIDTGLWAMGLDGRGRPGRGPLRVLGHLPDPGRAQRIRVTPSGWSRSAPPDYGIWFSRNMVTPMSSKCEVSSPAATRMQARTPVPCRSFAT